MKLAKLKSIKLQYWLIICGLMLVLLVGTGLRFYRLTEVPPALSWDEVSVGYNAYTIANWGRDEYGRSWPWTFKSFGDDKSPVHVYLTAAAVKVWGSSDFSTRLMPAVFGVLSIWMLYLLLVEMFESMLGRINSRILGLIGAIFLAISPYNLQFSRFNHEANFALFFFMLGLWLWFKAVNKDMFWWPFAMFSFGLSLLSYHSSKVVVPLMIVLLFGLYAKRIWQHKIAAGIGILVLISFGLLYRFQPDLLGTARLQQASIPIEAIHQLPIYQQTHNEGLARAQMWWQRYQVYFSPQYLFISGDQIQRHSDQAVGEFYKLDALWLGLGVIWLVVKRSRAGVVLLVWALVGPLPGVVAGGLGETGHAARALFTMGSWTAIAAIGCYWGISLLPKNWLKAVAIGVVMVVYGWLAGQYLTDYYQNYAQRSAIEWQYGMKQIVGYVQAHPEYSLVYMTDVRSQPYAFFLYYLQYPLTDYVREVEFNPTDQRPHNNVYSFERYHFGDWEQIQSMPRAGVLYIVDPSIYDGLAHKKDFEVKQVVKYPDGGNAYFIISGNQ